MHAACGKAALQTYAVELRHPVAAQYAQRHRFVKRSKLAITQPVFQGRCRLIQHTLVGVIDGFEKPAHHGLQQRQPIRRRACNLQLRQAAVHVVQPLQQAAENLCVKPVYAGLRRCVLPHGLLCLRAERITEQQAAQAETPGVLIRVGQCSINPPGLSMRRV